MNKERRDAIRVMAEAIIKTNRNPEYSNYSEYGKIILSLLDALDETERERDAAIADLTPDCAICSQDRKTCGQEYRTLEEHYHPVACDGFEWRGVPKEDRHQ